MKSNAQYRLIIFPHAGGTAQRYHKWATYFSDSPIEVVIIQYPGRAERLQQKPITSMTELIDQLYKAFQNYLDKPFLTYGHSLGGLVSYELMSKLNKSNQQIARKMIISGKRAPHLKASYQPVHKLTDSELIRVIREFNGTPSEILDAQDLLTLLLPCIRSDFMIDETYQHKESPQLDVALLVLGGENDPLATLEELMPWRFYVSNDFKIKVYQGDHFFHFKNEKEILSNVIKEISDILLNEQNQ